ncbi:Leu/Phe/Val dehydrogenase [Pedomonas sp. V897]|uniref:Leu/Phe/Val dehydrogenase n=1 Tax=Pedomonas sp. V897 TaxID=3446482 RepID=UPI003EDF85C8
MTVFSAADFSDHEQVVFVRDAETGLKAIIALHSTALGPAAGGCRMWRYASEEEALRDALRLSRGMSLKNAMADLALGGGKSVIMAPEGSYDRPALLRAFGRAVNSLGGRYITAEDVGTSVADMLVIRQETAHVSGLNSEPGKGGDPSPYTALGVYSGIKASVRHKLGKDSLAGLTIAVQGLGNVGRHLCTMLHRDGAKLIVTDIAQDRVKSAVDAWGAKAVGLDEILSVEADVLAPCALGAVLNAQTIDTLNVPVVAGAANNQLATAEDGERLRQRGILYAPDYVINAGGIIAVSHEILNQFDEPTVIAKVEAIGARLAGIFSQADKEGQSTAAVADRLAEEKIAAARKSSTVASRAA